MDYSMGQLQTSRVVLIKCYNIVPIKNLQFSRFI
jgi:hypothetical protein